MDVVDRINRWLENDEADDADKTLRDARAEIIRLRAELALVKEARDRIYVSSASTPDC